MIEETSEVEYLKWWFERTKTNPVLRQMMEIDFYEETGKEIPNGYLLND